MDPQARWTVHSAHGEVEADGMAVAAAGIEKPASAAGQVKVNVTIPTPFARRISVDEEARATWLIPRRSADITVAGQRRVHTGFPRNPPLA